MDWTYKGKTITTIPNTTYGFVYLLTYKSGMRYIGKKTVWSNSTLPQHKDGSKRVGHVKFIQKRVVLDAQGNIVTSKAKKKGLKGSIKPYEVVLSENSWKRYTGSSKEIPKEDTLINKEIIVFSTTKTTLTYLESYYLFQCNAPANRRYYNVNILGKFFDNCLDGYYKQKNIKEQS